jgi:RimJ/RimL family protein N-acetyltransferase
MGSPAEGQFATGYPERVLTPRLELRRWRDSDREAQAAIWADPDVLSWLRPDGGDPGAYAAESFERHRRHWEEHGFGPWAIVERESDAVIGWTGAAHPTFIPELADEVEIGWVLRRSYWGRGLAIEAARAALDAASEHLHAPRLISLIRPDNQRSIAVARRLGMAEAGEAFHPEANLRLRVYAL